MADTMCDRCYGSLDEGEHGHMKCPFMPRRANAVIADDIPGGIEIKHAICHEDGTPRKFYSKSEITKAARAAGFTNYVVHRPPPGTDKSPHTSRWV